MKKLVIITGPTATGKTNLAIKLAQEIGGEIISADSMQIYRGLDIGTAKPSLEQQRLIPHHLLDIIMPQENYSVAEFQKEARQIIEEISSRGKIPLLVGGTGLYIRALINEYTFANVEEDPKYRAGLNSLAEEKGVSFLHETLKDKDPLAAQKIHPNDLKRVIRALEINHLTGKNLNELPQTKKKENELYQYCGFVLQCERNLLYERINQRVDEMITAGLLEETRAFLNLNIPSNSTALQALGYKELIPHIQGECSLEEAVNLLKTNTRKYAKRQLTWFRNQLDFKWLDISLGWESAIFEIKEELKKKNLLI